MAIVRLRSLDDARVVYELDSESGALLSTKFMKPKDVDDVRVCGFAGTEKKGLWRAPRGLFAVFLFEGVQCVWLDGVLADVEKEGWNFRVTRPAPGLRRFTASRQGEEVVSFLYWGDLTRYDPENILQFIVQKTERAEARSRFTQFWSEALESNVWPPHLRGEKRV
jgi:hypothetical protein